MGTNPQLGDRDELDEFIEEQVADGTEAEDYTTMVRGVNRRLRGCNFPITRQFQTVVQHNVIQVQRRGISGTTAHWREVPVLMNNAIAFWNMGQTFRAFVCFSGAVANAGMGWFVANQYEFGDRRRARLRNSEEDD